MSRRIVIAVVAALLGGLLAVAAAAPAAASSTSNPVADSYVDASAPGTNFGTALYVRADASPVRRAYLRFNVQGVGSSTSAVLRFFAESSSHGGLEAHSVSSTSWDETSINYNNAPAVGATLDTTGAFGAGSWVTVDVSSAVTGDGLVSFALTGVDDTAIKVTSREGGNKPQLIVPAPPSASPYLVSRSGNTYRAESQTTGTTFSGSLKSVVENAVADLESSGGGVVRFTAGTFDFGTEFFKFFDLADIEFAGAGTDATIIQNFTSAAADTEPFNFTGADRVTVRDLTVSAGGAVRTTSDALDFDRGNDVLVERVKVTASRGRGIVFDGKNDSWTSLRNTVRDCVITGTLGDGIELLASSQNRIEGCTITNVGGHGIQLNKSSPTADQANKKSSDNLVTANVIDQAGQDGVNVNSGDRNQLTGNTITNSSDDTSGRDGIRIASTDSITCNDNVVSGNAANDNQTQKTQKYGLNIASSLCNRTVVGPGNNFTVPGNLTAPIHDLGTGTIYR
jgi:parallel beta-helix repeat protein